MNKNMTSLAFASDHAGVEMKAKLIDEAKRLKLGVTDLGPFDTDSVDYPDYADKMADYLKEHPEHFGVLICGSGIGISIAANRHRHIRAALCSEEAAAQLARMHNDANVLCLGARLTDMPTAKSCLQAFVATAYEGGRHQKRVDKLG